MCTIAWLLVAMAILPTGLASAAGHVEPVVAFDAAAGELPESIAIDKRGNLYVSLATLGQIRKISHDGSQSVFATLSPPGDFPFSVLGLAIDAPGHVYAAVITFDPATHGVWRVGENGVAERLPGSEAIAFPNDLAFDKRGNLYVSDSILGGVWRIPPGGSAELWIQHALLVGDDSLPFPFPLGANGIAFRHGTLFVANTELGRIVRIPVREDGSAGAPQVLVEDPALSIADGIRLDVHGNIYVAVIAQNTIVRVAADGSTITTLATAADGLDFPSSVAFGTGHGDHASLFVTNFAIGPLFGLPAGAGPGVLKVDVGVAGLPLP